MIVYLYRPHSVGSSTKNIGLWEIIPRLHLALQPLYVNLRLSGPGHHSDSWVRQIGHPKVQRLRVEAIGQAPFILKYYVAESDLDLIRGEESSRAGVSPMSKSQVVRTSANKQRVLVICLSLIEETVAIVLQRVSIIVWMPHVSTINDNPGPFLDDVSTLQFDIARGLPTE